VSVAGYDALSIFCAIYLCHDFVAIKTVYCDIQQRTNVAFFLVSLR